MSLLAHKHFEQEIHIEPQKTEVSPVVIFLRMIALQCRASARADLFKACAMLSHEPNISVQAVGDALVKCLPQALRKRPVFYAVSEQSLSFDEAWLTRLVSAISAGDTASAEFLLKSRITPEARRNVQFLASKISEHFALV
ncbi:MAG: hypothetical protein AAF826_03505 [Pseudomonadota bacterium]